MQPNPQVWTHLLNESLMENFVFCAVRKSRNQNEMQMYHKQVFRTNINS